MSKYVELIVSVLEVKVFQVKRRKISRYDRIKNE